MFKAGAVGYLLKDSASAELLQAIRAVADGLTYVSPAIAATVVVDWTAPNTTEKPLSTREREVLQLLAEGNTSKDIAKRLGIAVPTIETHRRQIMGKLKLHSIAELTKFAIREGLTSLD
jgi:DNA-binding NarL/FixJ family response regulator